MSLKAFDLAGKVALVTGGNGGIGLGMAEALAEAGSAVAIWGRDAAKTAAAGEQLARKGRPVLAEAVDVADEAAVTEGIRRVVDRLGRLDAVFANAGISGRAPSFIDMTTAEYRRVLSVNLDGVFFTLREAARHMVARAERGDRGGSLVGLSSLGAIHGMPRSQAYAAAKGAVVTIMRSCAVELARYDIRSNIIQPGWIATDMTTGAQNSAVFTDRVIGRVPFKRWGTPADFGGIAVYLASDASRYHNGDTFLIDGGYAVF